MFGQNTALDSANAGQGIFREVRYPSRSTVTTSSQTVNW